MLLSAITPTTMGCDSKLVSYHRTRSDFWVPTRKRVPASHRDLRSAWFTGRVNTRGATLIRSQEEGGVGDFEEESLYFRETRTTMRYLLTAQSIKTLLAVLASEDRMEEAKFLNNYVADNPLKSTTDAEEWLSELASQPNQQLDYQAENMQINPRDIVDSITGVSEELADEMVKELKRTRSMNERIHQRATQKQRQALMRSMGMTTDE